MVEDKDNLFNRLKTQTHSDGMQVLKQYCEAELEGFRDILEKVDSPEVRGKAKFCRDLLQLFA